MTFPLLSLSFLKIMARALWDLWTGPFAWGDGIAFYNDNWIVFTILACCYYPAFVLLEKLMQNRKSGFNIKPLLFVWNILLAIFSIWGSISVYPTISRLHREVTDNALEAICYPACFKMGQEAARWVFFFNLSKLPEWLDTYFLVLRKKPVIFLHWYHHIATYLFCWASTLIAFDVHCGGFHFATMNLIVHSFMYTYYAWMIVQPAVASKFAMFITISQLVQMVIGTAIVIYSPNCPTFQWSDTKVVIYTAAGLVMYGSYFYLFLELFIKKYFVRRPTPKGGAQGQKQRRRKVD